MNNNNFKAFWLGCLLGICVSATIFYLAYTHDIRQLNQKLNDAYAEVASKTNSLYEARVRLEKYEGQWRE